MASSVFEFDDYKGFVDQFIAEQPKGGRGFFRKMAMHLGVNPVIISQVFRGDRHLSLEQGALVTELFGLNPLERDFFLLLIQYSRAGNMSLRRILKEQMEALRVKAQDLKSRLPPSTNLSEEAKALFYSQWYYSAIRLLTSLPEGQTAETLTQRLNLPLAKVREVLEFLEATGLCVERDGRLQMGPSSTHVPKSSPWVAQHHQNWRLKAINTLANPSPEALHFTGPMVLSHALKAQVREHLLALISETTKAVADAPSETTMCLTIDWFEF